MTERTAVLGTHRGCENDAALVVLILVIVIIVVVVVVMVVVEGKIVGLLNLRTPDHRDVHFLLTPSTAFLYLSNGVRICRRKERGQVRVYRIEQAKQYVLPAWRIQ